MITLLPRQVVMGQYECGVSLAEKPFIFRHIMVLLCRRYHGHPMASTLPQQVKMGRYRFGMHLLMEMLPLSTTITLGLCTLLLGPLMEKRLHLGMPTVIYRFGARSKKDYKMLS